MGSNGGWGDWAEVKLLVKELLERQDERVDEIQANITWLVRAVILSVIGILANAVMNFLQLRGGK